MTDETLFELARKTPESERAALLNRACEGKPGLRKRVEVLLAADASSSPLSKPSPALDATTGFEATKSYTSADPTPGVVIADRYTLEQKLGEGGMGEVWVAKQSEPVKRRVALKLIKAGMDSKSVVQRFEQERQALAMMDHPHIAKVLDGGITADRRPYFVMELVNGLPLTKFCDETKLGIKERLELFVPICQAVQHAHQKGIIHRDLKPANILVTMIDGKPVPKVIDFGVAKATGGKLTDESMSTQFGAVVGTLEYMSPEQAGFSSEDIDTRADIYSLGVILYELLTGLRPFDSKRLKKAALDEMIRIIREEEPSKPSTRLSTDESLPSLAASRHIEPGKLTALLRGELDWVVMKCLEKQRDRRYETANGLARDIQRYLNDEVVEARPPSAGYRFQKYVTRHKGQVIAVGLVLLALIAGVIGTSIGFVRAQEEKVVADDARVEAEHHRTIAEEQRELAVGNEQKAILEKENTRRALARAKLALAEAAYREKDGRTMTLQLGEVPADLRDTNWKYLLEHADTSLATVKEYHVGATAHPVWPGIFVAATKKGTIAIINAKTGAYDFEFPFSEKQKQSTWQRGLAISPDGERLAAGSLGVGGITIYDIRSGKPLVEWDAPETNTVEFSHDGKTLLQTSAVNNVVCLWDAITGAKLWEITNATCAKFDTSGKQVIVERVKDSSWHLAVVKAPDGTEIKPLSDLPQKANDLAIRPDGKMIVTGDSRGFVRFHDVESGRVLFENRLQNQKIGCLAFTKDSSRLVSVAVQADKQVVSVWDANTGDHLQSLLGNAGKPESLVVHPLSYDVLVTGPSTKVWNITRDNPKAVLQPFNSAAFLGRDDWCICGSRSQKAAVFSIDSNQPKTQWEADLASFEDAEVSRNGRVAVLAKHGFAKSELVLYDADNLKLRETHRLSVGADINFLRLSPDGNRLLSFMPLGKTANLIDTRSGKLLNAADGIGVSDLRLDSADVASIIDSAWLSNTRVVNLTILHAPRGDSRSEEGLILFDIESRQQLGMEKHGSAMTCLAAAPDGLRFAEAGVDKSIRIRDGNTLKVLREFRAHDDNITALAWHPNLPLLASASADLVVKLWDLNTGQCLREIRGVVAPVGTLRFDPAGTYLLTVSGNVVRIWETRAPLIGPRGLPH